MPLHIRKLWMLCASYVSFAAALCLAQSTYEASDPDLMQPLAVVVTKTGKAQLEDRNLKFREHWEIAGQRITHGFQSDLGVVLSNQISLHSSDGADWSINRLEGVVRGEDVLPWQREATRSTTEITIRNGTLAFSAAHLNDESLFEITTPVGVVRLARASGVIRVRDGFVSISIDSGEAWVSNELSQHPMTLGADEYVELSGTSSLHLERIPRDRLIRNRQYERQLEIVEQNAQRVYFPKNTENFALYGKRLADVTWISQIKDMP